MVEENARNLGPYVTRLMKTGLDMDGPSWRWKGLRCNPATEKANMSQPRFTAPPERLAKAKRAHKNGATWVLIAHILNTSPTTARKVAQREGWI